jgi:hypothetical protein
VVYDNACKLDDFCRSRSETSVNAKLFNNLHYVVDRLHIQGHIGAKCLMRNHPANFPELKGVNTMVCEQSNFWVSGFKTPTKHMNHVRYPFFFYIIFDEYNTIKIEGKINVFEAFKQRLTAKKRKLTDLQESDA